MKNNLTLKTYYTYATNLVVTLLAPKTTNLNNV